MCLVACTPFTKITFILAPSPLRPGNSSQNSLRDCLLGYNPQIGTTKVFCFLDWLLISFFVDILIPPHILLGSYEDEYGVVVPCGINLAHGEQAALSTVGRTIAASSALLFSCSGSSTQPIHLHPCRWKSSTNCHILQSLGNTCQTVLLWSHSLASLSNPKAFLCRLTALPENFSLIVTLPWAVLLIFFFGIFCTYVYLNIKKFLLPWQLWLSFKLLSCKPWQA